MTYEKICAECGAEFIGIRPQSKYCSDACKRKVENRLGVELRKKKSTIEKQCEWCGKTFFTYSEKIRYCNKSCSAQGRVKSYGRPCKDRNCEIVNIRITRPLYGVHPEMQPDIGSVHTAEKNDFNDEKKFYLIRNIGKYGLIVRGDECEVVICE